jgi:plastocyanin
VRRTLIVMAACAVLAGCSDEANTPEKPQPIPSVAQPTGGPFVSVAVDNHFHDIHPSNHREIDADREFVIRNEGSNLHNVSIVGTKISQNIKPGDSFRVDPVSKIGPPGTYKIFCKYHVSQGMRGEITIVEANQ